MLLAVTESQTISSPYITGDPKLNRSNFKIQQTDYPPHFTYFLQTLRSIWGHLI